MGDPAYAGRLYINANSGSTVRRLMLEWSYENRKPFSSYS